MAIATILRCHEMYIDEKGHLNDIIPPPENDEWFRAIVEPQEIIVPNQIHGLLQQPALMQQFLDDHRPNANPVDPIEEFENNLFDLVAQQIFMQFQANFNIAGIPILAFGQNGENANNEIV